MRSLLFPALAAVVVACSTQAPDTVQDQIPMVPSSVPVDFNDLIGEWEDVQDSGRTVFNEHWSRAADGTLVGLGFVLSGKDTVFIEHLGILHMDTSTYYAATVNNQNSGAAVLFKLVHSFDSLVFTAPDHDFPQRIVYTPVNGSWEVKVSGTDKAGKAMSDHYHFTRHSATVNGAVQ
ncbi:MAG TPA: DUF6265 family protein [Flavobacteriales bacterium]|nr:DUF6265 family protein [Flavobacteriales bacterium]